jgi:hypothetical protein
VSEHFSESNSEKLARLEQWVRDLQRGMFVNCVYCGHRYGREGEVPVAMAEVLTRHVANCPEHPMSKLVKLLEAAAHGFRSYQYGNAAPALAEEIADAIDVALAKVKP